MSPPFKLPAAWPAPADKQAADRLAETFPPSGKLRRGAGLAMLRAIGGNAPFLADLARRDPAIIRRVAEDGPDAVVATAMAALDKLPPNTPRATLAAALRQAKRHIALATALADIGNLWTLERVTETLSDLAETALSLSVAHLLRAGHDDGEFAPPDLADPAAGSGFTVLGMGKLGARELNFSSDIDLILLHDANAAPYRGDAVGAFFTRIARGLVALMEARDADGYVFRTDLRLRPDPAATPPSMSLGAAIAYYESMGQNWERAAMLKARPVAGDLAMGHAFLAEIRPFVWRRHLDFAAIADIHAMKRRIDAHKGTALGVQEDPAARILGHNVKLGAGGIREIEFLAQTLQLVWGGRDPGLRTLRTLDALRLLVRAGRLKRVAAAELARAYRFHRRVEHRLQMVNDRQTHTLPETQAALGAFATFMGYPSGEKFAADLLRHLDRVQERYLEVFENVPESDESSLTVGRPLDISGVGEATPETIATLTGMGFKTPDAIVATVRGWHAGRVRALRSARARDLMNAVLPALLRALARQPQPDAAFARLDGFLARLPAGVQLLSLIQRNPALADRIAAILGAAPSLADHLARAPEALEGLLTPEQPPDPARTMRARLADARALEDAIAIIRATVRADEFSTSVATMEGRLDADAAGLARTAVADAALAQLLPRVLEDFSARFGRVRGGGLAVVVLGKAGSREMMAGSDLDLMLVYDHPERVTQSTGGKTLPASQWFIRAVHAFVAALTAPDAEGPMYAIDMRLRPSGNKGPVAVPLAGFARYHATDAWTWERMALTRARVVAGPPALRSRVEAAIATAIATAGDPARIRADAASMRARLLRDLPQAGPWDVKLRPGGQIEVEFIAQALQLIQPRAADPTTRTALANLAAARVLPEADAALLIRADRVWRTVQGLLRITYGRKPADTLSEATLAAIRRALDMPSIDIEMLRATLDVLAGDVRAAFIRNIGEIRL